MEAVQPEISVPYANRGARTDKNQRTEGIAPEPEDEFAGSVCNQPVILPPADFDAFVEIVQSAEGPNAKLRNGAEWFKQNGF